MKLPIPTIASPTDCIIILVPVDLVPYFRLFFSDMMQKGKYQSREDATRGISYFSEVEAAMITCNDFSKQIQDNQDLNACVLGALLTALLTGDPTTFATALAACQAMRGAAKALPGSPEYAAGETAYNALIEIGIGRKTNQVEGMQAMLINAILGPGSSPVVD